MTEPKSETIQTTDSQQSGLREPQKIFEMEDELRFIAAGLPPEVAQKAAKAVRESEEKHMPNLKPGKKAYVRELRHLESEAEKDQN